MGADDIDDDFSPDAVAVPHLSGDDEPWSGIEQCSEPVPLGNGKKRKREAKDKKSKKPKLDRPADDVDSIARQSPAQISEYLTTLQNKSFPKLSSMELEDLRIPEASIADTTAWTHPRKLENFKQFVIETLPVLRTRLRQRSKANGAPCLIFVASAAMRVVEATRILKDKSLRGEKGGEVAKLFAKHFKLEEHVAYLKRTKVGTAVGTPGRIGKLLCQTDALSVSALTHIVLDISFRDAKKRSLLDIPETRDEVFKTVLGSPSIQDGLRSGKIQFVFF